MSKEDRGPLTDLLKKAISLGADTALSTEDMVKGVVQNLKESKGEITNSVKEILKKNLEEVKKLVNQRARIIAVTKYFGPEVIRDLYHLGHRDFGENRIEALEKKSKDLQDLKDLRWHFIGKLQSKKIKKLVQVKNIYAIHSVDRLKVLSALKENNYKGFIFIQVNISDEEQKSGFESIDEVNRAVNFCRNEKMSLKGFMGMGALDTEEARIHKSFKSLKTLRDQIEPSLELSMGMSSDFMIALEYNASWLRVGSRLYKGLEGFNASC